MHSVLEEEARQSDANQQRGIVSFDWDKYVQFTKKESFLDFANCSAQSLRQIPRERLMDLQTTYYNKMLEKENSLLADSFRGRDEILTLETRKRGADNAIQFERIVKCSKPSSPVLPKKLYGAALF